jgi:adenine-specific DNA-methyltransferase
MDWRRKMPFQLLDGEYLKKELATYIGNKRKLLPFIDQGVQKVRDSLDGRRLKSFDGFSGTGCVSRLLKMNSYELHSNDLEAYAKVLADCWLPDRPTVDMKRIAEAIAEADSLPLKSGFIAENYAPRDDRNIQPGERVFYTTRNAQYIDAIRGWCFSSCPEDLRPFVLGPLMVEASIHVNTSGVFKGFHKDSNGVGKFGGKNGIALSRIMQDMHVFVPTLVDADCEFHSMQMDVEEAAKQLDDLDLAYYDPPYNQHPYGSNYFMLNIIASKDNPELQEDGVSGIAKHWNRSEWNNAKVAGDALDRLTTATKAKFILFSYNNEGIIPLNDFKSILERHGRVERMEQAYDAYKGSRNFHGRPSKVVELLWLLEKS